MTGRERSPEQRHDLRERRTRRRARKERNEAQTWTEKARRVRSPIDEAAHEWDRLRARIRGLKDRPAEDREWSRLAGWLRRFGDGP